MNKQLFTSNNIFRVGNILNFGIKGTSKQTFKFSNLDLVSTQSLRFNIPIRKFTSSNGSKTDEKSRGWRKYKDGFKNRPGSHLTAFAILHEVTAIAPIFLIYYVLQEMDLEIPLSENVLKGGNRYINKLREVFGFEKLDEDSKVMVHLVASYGIVKAAMPLRIACCFALTPFVSRRFVEPISRLLGKTLSSAFKK
ncbi:hypothetical protein BB559_005394 [Furculomyces boomerangus]|uniref:Uncharacterized protein n=1 Tax=Furculomyces boomerangus TaxID=61424 RepID=A0A2T9Y8W3_9FUNG|nr:hypothetical protein BB559_005394 [Furculomyces boomerangus]